MSNVSHSILSMEIFTVIVGILGGGSAVVTGLFAYFGNLRLEKFKADLAETNAKLKASLDSSVHVSKVQFDREFSIYQSIWSLLVALRTKTLSLRPIVDRIDPNEPEEERMQRRLKSYWESFSAFRDGMEQNRPFYANTVYESLCQIFDLCCAEAIDYQYKEHGRTKDYWEKSEENNKKIISAIDSCCERIRERIASLSVAS